MKILKKIVGLKCCDAYLGYAGILKLSFGKKIYYTHPKLRDKFHGEFDIHIETYSWRLIHKNAVLTGSSDDNAFIDNKVQKLVNIKLSEIIINGSDLILSFQNQLHIEAYCSTGTVTEIISISSEKHNQVIENIGGKWTSKAYNKSFRGLTPEEQIKDKHSEETTKRWEINVPKKSNKGKCKNCAYYLPIVGEFYFWDYGLCSNKDSEFDGKAVRVDSNCKKWHAEIIE